MSQQKMTEMFQRKKNSFNVDVRTVGLALYKRKLTHAFHTSDRFPTARLNYLLETLYLYFFQLLDSDIVKSQK